MIHTVAGAAVQYRSETPDVVWRTVIPVYLVVQLLVVLAAAGTAGRRRHAWVRPLVLGAGFVVVWLVGVWFLLAPSTVRAVSQDGPPGMPVAVQCGSPRGNAWLRGVPDDSSLSPANLACRKESQERLVEILIGTTVVAVAVVVLAGWTRPERATP